MHCDNAVGGEGRGKTACPIGRGADTGGGQGARAPPTNFPSAQPHVPHTNLYLRWNNWPKENLCPHENSTPSPTTGKGPSYMPRPSPPLYTLPFHDTRERLCDSYRSVTPDLWVCQLTDSRGRYSCLYWPARGTNRELKRSLFYIHLDIL